MPRKPPMFEKHPVSYMDAKSNNLVRAVCFYVVDGDTADFLLDLGWYQYAYKSLRFRGINTPEIRGTTGKTLATALAAKQRVEELLLNQPVVVRSHKQQVTFERFVADVYFASDQVFEGLEESIELSEICWYSMVQLLLSEGLGESL